MIANCGTFSEPSGTSCACTACNAGYYTTGSGAKCVLPALQGDVSITSGDMAETILNMNSAISGYVYVATTTTQCVVPALT